MKMKKNRIMVIDDDELFLEEINEALNLSGFTVSVFKNSSDACRVINKFKPDIILLNLNLLNHNELRLDDDICLSDEFSHTPIIAMTVFFIGIEELLQMCFFCIKKVIIKPFDPQIVIRAIEDIVIKSHTDGLNYDLINNHPG